MTPKRNARMDQTGIRPENNEEKRQENGWSHYCGAIPNFFAVITDEGLVVHQGRIFPSPVSHSSENGSLPSEEWLSDRLLGRCVETIQDLKRQSKDCSSFSVSEENAEKISDLILCRLPSQPRFLVLALGVRKEGCGTGDESSCQCLSMRFLDLAPFSLFITSVVTEDIRYYNPVAREEFGLNGWDVRGKSVKDFYSRQSDRKNFLGILYSRGMVRDYEITLLNTDRNPHKVLMSASFVIFEHQPGVLITVKDISSRRKIEEEIRLSEEKYRLITDNTQDVIWVYQPNEDRFSYVSPSIFALRGISVEKAMGERMKDTLTPESYSLLSREFSRLLSELDSGTEGPVTDLFEVQQPTASGSKVWVEISVKFRKNAAGLSEVIGVARNIQERKNNENEVLYLSTHDQLTGLFNRRYYEEELKRVDIEKNLPITLIMADVNGLKLTNDAFGHSAGDKLLKTFADIMKKEAGPSDVIARVGGDEFVVIMKKTGPKEAEAFVDRTRRAISSKQMVKAILSVSFGWKTKVNMTDSMEEIYKQSEDDMYRNKLFSGSSFKNDILNLITKSLFDQNAIEKSHAESVSEWCQKTAIALGMDDADVKELGLAGLLHDIGKIAIPESILVKNESLTKAETVDIRRHPEVGYQILRSVSDFANIAQFVLNHHERIDGTGYPRGLKGDEIPLQSRIIAIAEAYDDILRKHPYRKSHTKETAVAELMKHSGTQFDPMILEVFVKKVLQAS
jgi:diguanylate cyclase (GGDEF)-like protein/PAS domain S-box-containing protein/putative nucleotidyltransferase with HDIG domain